MLLQRRRVRQAIVHVHQRAPTSGPEAPETRRGSARGPAGAALAGRAQLPDRLPLRGRRPSG